VGDSTYLVRDTLLLHDTISILRNLIEDLDSGRLVDQVLQLRGDSVRKEQLIGILIDTVRNLTDETTSLNSALGICTIAVDSLTERSILMQDTIRKLTVLNDSIYNTPANSGVWVEWNVSVITYPTMFMLNIVKLKAEYPAIYSTDETLYYRWYRYNPDGNDVFLGEGSVLYTNTNDASRFYFVIETTNAKKARSTYSPTREVIGAAQVSKLQVYPSVLPRGSALTVQIDGAGSSVQTTIMQVYDVRGTLIDEQVLDGQTAIIEVPYTQGSYFMQVGTEIQKIVVE
jgi:hypothetical protein